MRSLSFDDYRTMLRTARVQDALHGERQIRVEAARDKLLEVLAFAVSEAHYEFDSIREDVLDTSVSLALTEVEEVPQDSLSVVLMCVQVLAEDGQFARLSLLADRLINIGSKFRAERPYLHAAIHSFGLAMQGKTEKSRQTINAYLSQANSERFKPRSSREQAADVLLCACVREMVGGASDTLLGKARDLSIRTQDGPLFEFVDALNSWRKSARKADPARVLADVDETFSDPRLALYLEQRRLSVLFPPQIHAIRQGATLDLDKVVSLPTSSGKTLLAEFRVAAALTRSPGKRAIYVAPYRLLSRQVQRNFSRGLRPLGLSVKDLGSGYDPALENVGELTEDLPDVAVCTPERLDSLLRLATNAGSSGDQARQLFESCKLLIFDELQLIGRQGRGARFEFLLTRIRSRYPEWDILGLCAASSDTDRISDWLTGQRSIAGARRPTGTLEIVWKVDGSLKQRVPGRPSGTVSSITRTNPFNDAATLILRLDSKYRPVLAVEPTRAYAENLAKRVNSSSLDAGSSWRGSLGERQLEEVDIAVEEIKNLLGDEHPLAALVSHGVAYHHAGLPTPILRQIERLSARRLIRVVCATTTVAEGADLPFRAVVIPHLNFHGSPLSKDLYLNIIGRAGRAGVSVEGMVFILDSGAPTLRNLIESQLWSARTDESIDGALSKIPLEFSKARDWFSFYEVQSQVLSWLGEGNSYVDEQALFLASQTLSWNSPRRGVQDRVTRLIDDAFNDLEERGFAVAGSPYTLTDTGALARLTGLAAPSVSRLLPAVAEASNSWLPELIFVSEINAAYARKIVELLFESIEMMEKGFWLRKVPSKERDQTLAEMIRGERDWPYGEENFETDIDLMSAWLLGVNYSEISEVAPRVNDSRVFFGGNDRSKRVSDAAEYVGSNTYAAAWVWSAVKVLAGGLGGELPGFIRDSIELGLPSEGAVRLVKNYSLSRPGALMLTRLSGPSWAEVRDWVRWNSVERFASLPLTRLDMIRLGQAHSSLNRG